VTFILSMVDPGFIMDMPGYSRVNLVQLELPVHREPPVLLDPPVHPALLVLLVFLEHPVHPDRLVHLVLLAQLGFLVLPVHRDHLVHPELLVLLVPRVALQTSLITGQTQGRIQVILERAIYYGII